MQVSPVVRPYRSAIATIIALMFFATACSGGVRPTLTGDRLDESALSTAADVAPGDDSQANAAQTSGAAESDDPAGAAETADASTVNMTPSDPGVVEQFVVEIIETFPHDPSSYTQGLELHDGFFFESAGARGPGNVIVDSSLRRVDPATGQVEQSITIEQPYFAEGLTKVGDQLIQLTWKSNVAFYWNAATFELEKQVTYAGEGWGLCYDGSQLLMTDGTPTLITRDPTTFDELSRVPVTFNGVLAENVQPNEIECVNGVVWANDWLTNQIVRIDPATGNITAVVDATSLDRPLGDGGAVLNGIAWDAATESFYVTGKLWPTMYRVNFVTNPAG